MIPNRMFLLAIFLISLVVFRPVCSGAADRAGLPDWLTAPGDETGRQSVMFVFGHFDDDSVISGTINMFVRAGWEVNVVWVTSAGMDTPLWGTTAERRAEMEDAADAMGLPDENRHVLGFPDRQAVNHLAEIADLVVKFPSSRICEPARL